jgi:hypothetical protein
MPTHDHNCNDWLHGQVIHALKDWEGNAYCGLSISAKLQRPAPAWDTVTCESCLKTVTLCRRCKGTGRGRSYKYIQVSCTACKGTGVENETH